MNTAEIKKQIAKFLIKECGMDEDLANREAKLLKISNKTPTSFVATNDEGGIELYEIKKNSVNSNRILVQIKVNPFFWSDEPHIPESKKHRTLLAKFLTTKAGKHYLKKEIDYLIFMMNARPEEKDRIIEHTQLILTFIRGIK